LRVAWGDQAIGHPQAGEMVGGEMMSSGVFQHADPKPFLQA